MNWPTACLGELCQINIGRTPSRSEPAYWEDGNNPWLSISDMGRSKIISSTKEGITDTAIQECNMRPVQAGTVLFSFKLSIGKLGIAAANLFTNEAIASLPILDRTLLCEDYLFHALQQISGRLVGDRAAMGTTLNKASLAQIEIPLPPLAEQRRIAAILDKAADLNSLSKMADQLVNDLRVSRLRQLLSSEVSHQSKSKYVPLSDLIRGKPNNGIFRKNPEYQDPDSSSGLPVVWVEQLFRGEVLELSACKKLDATNAEIAKYGLMNGDILFCRSSLKLEGIAKSNIYVGACGQALFECHLIRISPDPAKINPIFLNECLNLPEIRAEARRLSKTSTMTTIDQDGILAIAVPLPPLHIQEQFAQDFELLQNLSTRRRASNHTIGLLMASLSSLQLGKT